MIQYIHKKGKKSCSLIITTPLLQMYTQGEQREGDEEGRMKRPSDKPTRNSNKSKYDDLKKKKKSPKLWLRSFQAAAKRPDTVSPGEGCVIQSPFSPFLSVCPPSLTHCLDPDRKPGRPGPDSESRLFLLLCDCFLFTPAASLHAPGGPVLIRVPACSRAVPEGCVAVGFPSEKVEGGLRGRGGWVVVGPIWGRGQRKGSSPRWSKDSVEGKKKSGVGLQKIKGGGGGNSGGSELESQSLMCVVVYLAHANVS